MDQKDRMLAHARQVMQTTARALQKILDDDDDMILSAGVVGDADVDEGETMQQETQPETEETRIQKIRRATFERVSKLAYDTTPQAAEQWYDATSWSSFPAVNRQAIYERFKDPRYRYPELPTNPRHVVNNFHFTDDVRIRLENVLEIICLLEDLHSVDPSNDARALLKRVEQQRERYKYRNETPVERLRRLAFQQCEEISGVPAEKLAKVFDRIPWSKLRTERFEELEALIFENVSRGEWQREPRDPIEREKWKQRNKEAAAAHKRAKAAVMPVTRLVENLRAEIASYYRKQSASNRAA